jgi:hypothetical protein
MKWNSYIINFADSPNLVSELFKVINLTMIKK